ncbi:hypothetical protein AK830_g9639 [Neonectria ditissima]|uniref:Uncharacterized protein n=1 Tax=Neonectria ditissima TaxID=78410 RepID=A0A0P7AHL6_9HYPO|nr:hypothetical protein AK830_g9639 [Neonectria ditissima]
MNSIEIPFTIFVDGKPVGFPAEDEDRFQARAGPQPAVFSLRDGRLQSQGWFLGRSVIEDMSLMPKRVYWFKVGSGQEDAIQRVDAFPNGGSFDLKFAGRFHMNRDLDVRFSFDTDGIDVGAPLVIVDGNLFAALLPEPQQPVQIRLQ